MSLFTTQTNDLPNIKKSRNQELLISLSNEIAALRNRNDLFELVNGRIKELFSISEFGIAQINENRHTYGAFMIDVGNKIKITQNTRLRRSHIIT